MNSALQIRARRLLRFAGWTCFAAVLAISTHVSADDRDILSSGNEPYVFVILDTSGSMHWTAPCSEDDSRIDIDPWDNACTSECTLGSAKCAQVCPNYGCLEYGEDRDDSTPIDIFMDSEGSGVTTTGGIWTSTARSTAWGGTYLTADGGADGSLTFTPTIPSAGEYALFIYTQDTGSADVTNLLFEVTSKKADGTTNITSVFELDIERNENRQSFAVGASTAPTADNDVPPGNFLGAFRFAAGTSGTIRIVNNNTTGADVDPEDNTVVIDAIRLSRLPQPSTVSCIRYGYRCQQPLCPAGDCFAPTGADDPTSKFYQAKQALYEVFSSVDKVNFGFGTYEQDNARVRFKHWMYKVSATDNLGAAQTPLRTFDGGKRPFPEIGNYTVFGTGPRIVDSNSDGVLNDGDGNYDCDTGSDDEDEIGCYHTRPMVMGEPAGDYTRPADVNDPWEMNRVLFYPKLGARQNPADNSDNDGHWKTPLYIRDTNGEIWIAMWDNSGTAKYGDAKFAVTLTLYKCADSTCRASVDSSDAVTTTGVVGASTVSKTIYYDLISDFSPFNAGNSSRFPMNADSYFNNRNLVEAENTCAGLEENLDWDENINGPSPTPFYRTALEAAYGVGNAGANDDAWRTFPFKWPWKQDVRGNKNTSGVPITPRVDYMDSGDFIPFDWEKTNRVAIMNRLAPNQTDFPGQPADFRTAVFFNNEVKNGDDPTNDLRKLRLKDTVANAAGETQRPLVAFGSTPLAASLRDFRAWYDNWKVYAKAFDPAWDCKKKYVVLLTDGDETCDGVSEACDAATELYAVTAGQETDRVRLYVVGFGLPGGGGALTCMARNGSGNPTEEPILPRNKDELVETLRNIFSDIVPESTVFASASIPAIQSTAADKIYLSSFTPIINEPYWPGRVDAFRLPLPLDLNGEPDISPSRRCINGSATLQSGCHLWDAASVLLTQAPDMADLIFGSADYSYGTNLQTRRVFYGQENRQRVRPEPLRLFKPAIDAYPEQAVDRLDLAAALASPALYSAFQLGTATAAELDEELHNSIAQNIGIKEVDNLASTKPCTGTGSASDTCRYVMGDIFHANPTVITGPSNFGFFTDDRCQFNTRRGIPDNCGASVGRGYREYVQNSVWRRRMLVIGANDGNLHFFDAGTHIKLTDPNIGNLDVFSDGTGIELFSYIPRMALPVIRDQSNGTQQIFSVDNSITVGDAFIDPVVIAGAAPKSDEREWRSLVIGGLREGGDIFQETDEVENYVPGYYALDVTQPDVMEDDPLVPLQRIPEGPGTAAPIVPTCLEFNTTSGRQTKAPGCETLAGEGTVFPLQLWTFIDSVSIFSDNGTPSPTDDGYDRFLLDEEIRLLDTSPADGIHDGGYVGVTPISYGPIYESNTFGDLGATWSRAIIGQVALCKVGGTDCDYSDPAGGSTDDLETRWVAIFGGGMDPINKNNTSARGTWLYMVDVETGEAIYKRRLQGSAPSDPAVLDIDQDGVFDVVYIGTTAGLLYKVDLRGLNANGEIPSMGSLTLAKERVLGWTPTDPLATVSVSRVLDSAWDPFPILVTDCPIYYPPALFRIPELNQYGILQLCGEREDMWEPSTLNPNPLLLEERVFTIVDEGFQKGDLGLPLTSTDLESLNFGDSSDLFFDVNGFATKDLLQNPTPGLRPGWTLSVPINWRSTGEPFLVAGIAIFSLFNPVTVVVPGLQNECDQSGLTFPITLSVKNGNPLFRPTSDTGGCTLTNCCGRCSKPISELTTSIHTTSTTTKNQRPGSGSGGYAGTNPPAAGAGDTWGKAREALISAIRDTVLEIFPSTCQINEKYEISLAVLRNSTGYEELARVPVVVCPGDWKD